MTPALSSDSAALLTTKQAAKVLGVRVETLYAYVSRGLLRSHGTARASGSRFKREDVARLRARSAARAGHTAVAAGAMRFGEPVLDTAITKIELNDIRYRGRSAITLATDGTDFERVATLLWTGNENAPGWSTRSCPFDARAVRRATRHFAQKRDALNFFERTLVALAYASSSDRENEVGVLANEVQRAQCVIRGIASSFKTLGVATSKALARSLLLPDEPRVNEAINRALVLVADHELNASSFSARITASSGASLYACISAALMTASGVKHGTASTQVFDFLDSLPRARDVVKAIAAVRGVTGSIPGFGHTLYPHGDPRARPLLELLPTLTRDRAQTRIALEVARIAREDSNEYPNIDFALTVVMRALGASRGAASRVFVVGRLAGWIAQVFEQREAGYILRPRARYVGQ